MHHEVPVDFLLLAGTAPPPLRPALRPAGRQAGRPAGAARVAADIQPPVGPPTETRFCALVPVIKISQFK